jgi:O-antigen/teichoic acid export membrane protein
MAAATAGLVAGVVLAEPIADLVGVHDPWLVRAAFVGVWAQMNYEQLTALFRVEERSLAFVGATLVNLLVTVGATVVLVVGLDQGARGVVVGNWIGTLTVYLGLLGYRREQLGLQFSRPLLREMQHFGWPLVPAALALIAVNFSDRFFLSHISGLDEVGKYELGVRIASAMVLLLTAFRTAWPAFAYSIEDDDEAKRTYAYVLTYLVFIASWLALGLAALSPWLVRLLASKSSYYEGSQVVGLLAFGTTAYAAYIVMAIGVGRARRTQFNWVITGIAAIVNLVLNLTLIPPFGMMGAAVATLAAYVVLFLGMTYWAQRVFPTPYQWRRVATAVAGAVTLAIVVKLLDAPLAVAFLLALAYPVVLVPLGFYLPAERRRFRGLLRLS